MSEEINKFRELYQKGKVDLAKSFEMLDDTISEDEESGDHFFKVRKLTDREYGLSYTLHSALEAIDHAMEEKNCREYSIIKTKIQEAIHWFDSIEN